MSSNIDVLRNINSENDFKTLIDKIKKISMIPPFLSIDQEGGRVERTENIHAGKKYLSAKFAYEKGPDFLNNQTREIAKELKSYGLNLNFAPCIDTNTNPNNPIIGERAFSSNPDDVIKGEKIVTAAYKSNGIIPCVKHFPGHGDADADSHLTLPKIDLSLEEKAIPCNTSLITNGEIAKVLPSKLYMEFFLLSYFWGVFRIITRS